MASLDTLNTSGEEPVLVSNNTIRSVVSSVNTDVQNGCSSCDSCGSLFSMVKTITACFSRQVMLLRLVSLEDFSVLDELIVNIDKFLMMLRGGIATEVHARVWQQTESLFWSNIDILWTGMSVSEQQRLLLDSSQQILWSCLQRHYQSFKAYSPEFVLETIHNEVHKKWWEHNWSQSLSPVTQSWLFQERF
jgi:hypothetical protein